MEKYIIYGTGVIALEKYNKIVEIHGKDSIECFIDSALAKKSFCNRKVIRPFELQTLQKNEYKYILGTLTNKKSMVGELLKQGVLYENIILERDYGVNSFEENVKVVNNILVYPPIEEEEVLTQLLIQLDEFVPNLNNLSGTIDIISKLSYEIEISNVLILDYVDDVKKYDLVLVWDKEYLDDANIGCINNVYCIDKKYFRFIDVKILLRLNLVLEKKNNINQYDIISKMNYKGLEDRFDQTKGYVFGTGPSCIDGTKKYIPRDSLKVVCNAMVNNANLMDTIKPNIYLIADEAFLAFDLKPVVDKIVSYCVKNKCIIFIPKVLGIILVKRYPEIMDYIVMLSFDTERIMFPTPDNLNIYRKAYNVITALAIPIASHICDDIYIAGCDGYNTTDHRSVAWRHADGIGTQSLDGSKYREEDNWNEDYYQKHISYFRELIEYGENQGKTYHALTLSHIPVLAEKYGGRK